MTEYSEPRLIQPDSRLVGDVRGLTLIQPWASLIVNGHKKYETRSWRPARWAIGTTLLIHAGKTTDCETADECHEAGLITKPMPSGAVVAVAKLKACHPTQSISAKITGNERSYGDWSHWRYAWELADVAPLEEPVPARGMLGLWRPTKQLLAAVEAQLERGRDG